MRLPYGVDFSRLRSMLSQSMLAFSFDLGGLLAGFFVGLAFHTINNVIFLLLYPAVLTVRGNISGILSGRLGTALHTGRIQPRLRNNTQEFYSLIRSTFVLSFVVMIPVGFAGFLLSLMTFGLKINDLLIFIMLPSSVGFLSATLTIPLNSILSVLTYKRGLDPDTIVYPIMSTVADIVVTLVYFGAAWMLFHGGLLETALSLLLFLLGALISLAFYMKTRKEVIFKDMIREATPVLLFCSGIATLSGQLLGGLKRILERRPGILILYPAVMDTVGDVGSIIGSTTTSRLHLGEMVPNVSTYKRQISELMAVGTSSCIMHMIYGFASYLLSLKMFLDSSLDKLVLTSLLSGLMSFIPISFLSFIIAVKTFKRGFDPDNFVIPIETSVADALATLSLSASVALIHLLI
ncbi:MAG: magnesium transporter [Candidatus Bathyarchaeia archaeon]